MDAKKGIQTEQITLNGKLIQSQQNFQRVVYLQLTLQVFLTA